MAARLTAWASTTSTWTTAWSAIAPDLGAELTRVGLADPLTWAGLLRDNEPAPRNKLAEVFTALGLLDVGPEDVTSRLDQGLLLAAAAVRPARDWSQQLAGFSEVQVNVDHLQEAKRARPGWPRAARP